MIEEKDSARDQPCADAGAHIPRSPLRIGIVAWGDPTDPECRRFWGLRVNGAYVGSPGKPALWATRAEALKARRLLAARAGTRVAAGSEGEAEAPGETK